SNRRPDPETGGRATRTRPGRRRRSVRGWCRSSHPFLHRFTFPGCVRITGQRGSKSMRRLIFPVLLTLATTVFAQKPAPATATATATTTTTQTTVVAPSENDSRDTREQFKELLRRTPPEVGKVLKLDPTLFNNQQYLSTYPALATFVAQHPEV